MHWIQFLKPTPFDMLGNIQVKKEGDARDTLPSPPPPPPPQHEVEPLAIETPVSSLSN